MIALLFSALFEILLFCGISFAVYQIFLSDYIKEIRTNKKKRTTEKDSVNKIALVKLVSDDAKDIEKFVSNNAEYLSDDIVKQLVARIEMIKCDRIIYEDSLNKRIENVAASAGIEDEEEESTVPVKRTRKR